MRFTKREYLDKQPEVGDRIVITYENMFNGYKFGTEMIITDISTRSGTCVFAFSPRHGRTVIVHDNEYEIFRDIKYEKVGEKTIVKKFLGIPFYKKIEGIYEEVDE